MQSIRYFLSSLIMLSGLFIALHSHATNSPSAVIERATSGVIGELKELKVEDRTETKVREIVLNWIIPAVDEQRVAMGALGKHWRSATTDQRQAFIELYREQQIKTYSGAFKAFDGEQITVTDSVLNPTGDKAIVKTVLKQKDGKEIPVDFRLYQKTKNDPWYVYDAVVAGLSLVKTYRDQLAEKLQNTTLEAFLNELSSKNSD